MNGWTDRETERKRGGWTDLRWVDKEIDEHVTE